MGMTPKTTIPVVSTHLQNIRQNWDHVFKDQGEQKKWNHHPVTNRIILFQDPGIPI